MFDTIQVAEVTGRSVDRDLARRFAHSARVHDGSLLPNARLLDWLDARLRHNSFSIERIPLRAMAGWGFERGTGNLVHDSGRFFRVEGLAVRTNHGSVPEWCQPIIQQPEIGILGIVVKEFDGVLHFLMQAKMEPGNVNVLQLSPTVQATHSNYTQVHRGGATRYLDYFIRPGRGRIVTDVLQSEQGAWFFRKRNRNMIVEVTEDVPLHDDFCWLTLGQLHRLLRRDNIVNMDARTVLSCAPITGLAASAAGARSGEFAAALRRSIDDDAARFRMAEVFSWFTEAKGRYRLDTRPLPLARTPGWHRTDTEIAHADQKYFGVVAVAVDASNREVPGWSQPLVRPQGIGLVAFLVRQVAGVIHVLVNARVEAGYLDTVELAPTVQCTPANYHDLPAEACPPLLAYVAAAPPEWIRYDAVQSEEGGRFYHAQNRYQVIEVPPEFPLDVPEGHLWLTVRQLARLVRYSHHLNVEARSLLLCLTTLC